AAELEARTQEMEKRKDLVQQLCDMVSDLQDRMNRFADALELRHRVEADAAQRQALLDEEEIPPPPGTPSPAISDTHEHHNTGDLHALEAKEPENDEDLPSLPPGPEFEAQPADAGAGVPLSYGKVPTSYVHSEADARKRKPKGG